jgi:hypothetical protein
LLTVSRVPLAAKRWLWRRHHRVQDASDDRNVASLTDREREIIIEVAHGLGSSKKPGPRDRVQVVVYAYQTGLVRPRQGD